MLATLGTMARKPLKRRLVVRIATLLISKIKFCADRDGRPVSSWVRKALSDAARRQGAARLRT
jgi:predicted HicB family RNase H-like nuclease